MRYLRETWGRIRGRVLERVLYTALRVVRFRDATRTAALLKRVTELERVTARIGGEVFSQGLALDLLRVHTGYWSRNPAAPDVQGKPEAETAPQPEETALGLRPIKPTRH